MNLAHTTLLSVALTCFTGEAQQKIDKGYYFVQSVSTYHLPQYSAITGKPLPGDSVTDAVKILEALKKTGIDGVEYEPLWFDSVNLSVHKRIAQTNKQYGIDLWESDWRLAEKINQEAFGPVPEECAAWGISADGTITLLRDSLGRVQIDPLNPLSVYWLLNKNRKESYGSFLASLRGDVQGYFFDETRLLRGISPNGMARPGYWLLPAYSPAVLALWKKYCADNNLTDANGKRIDKFPVHKKAWAAKNTSTYFQQGYQEIIDLSGWKTFGEFPRDGIIWEHWYRFISQTFANEWLFPIADFADSVLGGTENWKGIAYFQLIPWGLDFTDSLLTNTVIPGKGRWGAWAHAFGIDLRSISRSSTIKYFICEGYPPLTELQKQYFSVFKNIVISEGKKFGMMVHRDDSGGLNEMEENERWQLIRNLEPSIIARYLVKKLLSDLVGATQESGHQFYLMLDNYRKQKLNE